MYYVYILKLSNGNLYAGFTADIKARIARHKNNGVLSTKNKSPLLIHFECYALESDARRREKYLKTTEGKRLLRQQIRDILN